MRPAVRTLLSLTIAGVLLALGLAWARPGWLPAWAAIDVDRLAAWAHLGRDTPVPKARSDDEGTLS